MNNTFKSGLMPQEELTSLPIDMIRNQTESVIHEFLEGAKLNPGALIVIGCSSSEIIGHKIGSYSSEDVADTIVKTLYPLIKKEGYFLAAQCCEHLNRALIIEKEVAQKLGYEQVNVVPMPKAGGSFATKVYAAMEHPVAVEHIRAAGGIDIGDTLIGMHLKDVAVPLRISTTMIGQAHIVCARTRCKFIGGIRAQYQEKLL